MTRPLGATTNGPSPESCLGKTEFLDIDHPRVVEFAQTHRGPSSSSVTQVVDLFYAIRDGTYYSPWDVRTERSAFYASTVLGREPPRGHCIDKAMAFTACARYIGIPARLRFANVRNHIGTEQLERQLGSDLLVFHGYTELFIAGRWVAATPAFNKSLCERFHVEPLDFDGENDSIFQQYDRGGGRFMEYVHDYGAFADLPWDLMFAEWARYYPRVRDHGWPRRPGADDMGERGA